MRNQGEFLKKARTAANLNKSEMAKKLGFTAQFYGKIENGKADLPPAYFKKFLKITKADTEELFAQTLCDYGDYISQFLPPLKEDNGT